MILNSGNLRTLGTSFNAAFKRGLGEAPSQRALISTVTKSTTGQEEYGWLGKIKGVREWLGDRVLNSIATSDYAIKNKDWEDTISVDRNDIDDDNLSMYGMLFEEMGNAAGAHPDELIWGALKAGFNTNCYDGQFFFDTDHPVLDADGNPTSVSNTGGGAGEPWFLIDTSRSIKPIIFQERKPLTFVAKDKVDDDNVFFRKQFLYGVDARYNVGYGFWQYIYGSKQPLTPASYAAARAAMINMKGDYGRPLGIKPDMLIVSGANESAALKILNNELDGAGGTNEWKGTAKVEVVSWLA
jgi:phage major head subunit gpT-like protein